MNLLRSFCVMLLLGLASEAVAQTCPPGHPRVAPDERYSVAEPVADEFVVTDLATGLMWKRCSEGQSGATCTGPATRANWSTALTLANAANHAGFNDWRLPNREELRSLVETGCHTPAINTTAFPGFYDAFFYSSTSAAFGAVWVVDFDTGNLFTFSKDPNPAPTLRLVRGGRGWDTFASEADAVPDPFNPTPQSGVPLNSPRTSDPITVTGLTTVTGISVGGAASSSYSINGGTFTSLPGVVANNDQVRVRHISASTPFTLVSTTLTIGGVSRDFTSATANLPGAPIIGMATAGNGQASVGFSAPANDGGSAITAYTAISSPEGATSSGCTASPCTVSGLTNGTAYTFTVTATNIAGTGPASTPSNAVTPNQAPTVATTPALTLLEDGAGSLDITVGDDFTPPEDLIVVATSNNQTLITDAALAAGLGGSGANRTLMVQPAANANGSAIITVTVTDELGASAPAQSTLTVTPVNDPPQAIYASDRSHPEGTSGMQTVAGYVTAISPGPNEADQTVSFETVVVRDTRGILGAIAVDPDGSLRYTLSGSRGAAEIDLTIVDDGGTDNGGIDRGTTHRLRIFVGDVIDLVVDIERIAPVGAALSEATAKGATLASYRVSVVNRGPIDAVGARLVMTRQVGLLDALWSCDAPAVCRPVNGSGVVDAEFDLAVGPTLTLETTATVDVGLPFVDLLVRVLPPVGVMAVFTDDDHDALIEPAGPEGIFKDRFDR
jgi:hypothetical protein